MRYLFKYLDILERKLNDKYLMLFLDYDGTLTPIVEVPERAVLSRKNKTLLERLSKSPGCKIAIISGRALKDVRNKVGLKDIIYVGNHGLEIESPKIRFESPLSLRYKVTLKKIKNCLFRRLSFIKGAILEDKGLSLSLHYRLVDKRQIPKVKTILHEALALYLLKNKIKVKSGKMVFEVMPPVAWDKGKAVLWLLSRQKFLLRDKPLLPIYLGDDITDEDAFKALRNQGLTIFIGRPKQSYAKYYLKNTNETFEFIKHILEIQEGLDICQN